MSEGQRRVSFRCSALIDALIDVEDVFKQVGKSEGFLLAYFKKILSTGLTGRKCLQCSFGCLQVIRGMDRLDAYMGGAGIEVFIQSSLDLIFVTPHNQGVDKSIATTIVEISLTESQVVPALSVVWKTQITFEFTSCQRSGLAR